MGLGKEAKISFRKAQMEVPMEYPEEMALNEPA